MLKLIGRFMPESLLYGYMSKALVSALTYLLASVVSFLSVANAPQGLTQALGSKETVAWLAGILSSAVLFPLLTFLKRKARPEQPSVPAPGN